MGHHKPTPGHIAVAVAVAACFGPLGAGRPSSPSAAALPEITPSQRAFLSRVARRAARDAVLGRPPYTPGYVPSALEATAADVVVRLRLRGYLLAHAAAGSQPIAGAVRDAAVAVGQTASQGDAGGIDLIDGSLIEIEVIGPPEPIEVPGDWSQPRAVDPFVEPGIHGLAFLGPKVHHSFCPTELYTTDLTLPEALRRFAETSHLDPSSMAEVRVARFRTLHWYETPDDNIVSLRRGLTLVPPEAVSPAGLDDAIARLADYMVYRQRGTGLFSYQFEAGHDRYTPDEDNLVRQVGAAAAMAIHAKWSGKSASRAAADLAIRHHLTGLTNLPTVENASFVATPDAENKLGVTALLCLAMARHPDAERFRDVREKLVNGMLWLQRPSGMFLTAFPPAATVRGQEYFPGEALLALAEEYEHNPEARILDAFDRAVSFYQDYFREAPSPAFVPWQVQAFARMARQSKRVDFRDFVFELTDWLAARQLNDANCDWPELYGGVAAYQPGRAGVATAAYLEGFADALSLARSAGDAGRAARYERVVRGAARFVMQLQVRPEEAYFCPSPRDSVGGIRTGPALNLLRIDHGQHALIALMKTRDVLFPDRG